MPLNQRELSTELHKVQTKINDSQEKFNTVEANLREEMSLLKRDLRIALDNVGMMKSFFKVIGVSIIIFDIVKDDISNKMVIQYQPGFNWQQWVLLLFGFVLAFIGIYRKKK